MPVDKHCPCCGQPMPEKRMGVRLTPLKTRIFDIIQRAGPDGIDGGLLWFLVQDDGRAKRSWQTLKSHIWQINDALDDAPYRLRSTKGNGHQRGVYRLVKLTNRSRQCLTEVASQNRRAFSGRG